MAEMETEISTPVETSVDDTSVNVEPETSDTSTAEPETTNETAETETTDTTDTQKLYAGKYKSVEELVNGYKSLESKLGQPNEFEQKYNDLLKQQAEKDQKMRDYQQQLANQRGFKTVEEAQIADKVQLQEFQYYWQNLNTVDPQYSNDVEQVLQAYYQTGNKAYLEEAKRYFPSNFIEQVALATNNMERDLRSQLEQYRKNEKSKADEQLANTLKTDFAEFLGDLEQNKGKARALESFCGADFINSVEDMKVFEQIYSDIAKYEREQAIKEYEAKKVIDETKNKSSIGNVTTTSFDNNKKPTQADIATMSQAEFDRYCKLYGDDWIWETQKQ